MKILFVVNEIFPDLRGGVHTYIYEVAVRLAGMGHAIYILTKNVTGEAPHEEVISGINIRRYKLRNYKLAFLTQISCVVNIYKEFKKINGEHRFDLINLHSPHGAYAVNLSRKAKKIPKVYTFYALLHKEEILNSRGLVYKWYQWRRYAKLFWSPLYPRINKWLEKNGLEKCDKIISLSDYTSGCLLRAHRISPDRIAKIPGGVDVERFRPAADKGSVRKELGLPAGKTILFTVRRLVSRMGLDNLIRAMPVVLARCPGTILIIGGEGPMKPELRYLIDELNLGGSITLTGLIDDVRLPLYYQASDLFILPTKELEGFGIVTLEALASGVPVLGTPVGGTVEILSRLDKNLLFEDTSPRAMAGLIIEYLADDKKRSIIQERCRPFILGNYSWDKSVRRIEMLFSQIIEG